MIDWAQGIRNRAGRDRDVPATRGGGTSGGDGLRAY
jgi:hypothetical protein